VSKESLEQLSNIMTKRILYRCLFLLASLIVVGSLPAQGWVKKYGMSLRSEDAFASAQTRDGGSIIIGTANISSINKLYAIRLDVDGRLVWEKVYDFAGAEFSPKAMTATPDDNYVVVGEKNSTGDKDAFIMKISPKGDVVWEPKIIGSISVNEGATCVLATTSNEYILAGYMSNVNQSDLDIIFAKYSAAGELKDYNQYTFAGETEYANSIIPTTDGGYILAGYGKSNPGASPKAYILKAKADGSKDYVITDKFQNLGQEVFSILPTEADDTYLIVSKSSNGLQLLVTRAELKDSVSLKNQVNHSINLDGGARAIVSQTALTSNKDVIIAAQTVVNTQNDIFVLRTNSQCQTLWSQSINIEQDDTPAALLPNADNGFLFVGSCDDNTGTKGIVAIKFTANGKFLANTVSGTVFNDLNGNCVMDANEPTLKGWLIKAEGSSGNRYATSDEQGHYSMFVDTGKLIISSKSPSGYWTPCQNYDVNIVAQVPNIVLPFAVRNSIDCPLLEVDVASQQVTQCSNMTYTVNYTNIGTKTAANAYVELIVDAKHTINGSSLPWTSLVDKKLRFDIGNIKSGEQGNFKVYVSTSCNSEALGQTYTVNAHIYPDADCLPISQDWDKSSIQVEGTCKGDSVQFKIKNVGTAPANPSDIQYEIVEDVIIFLQKPIKALLPGESMDLTVPADGATYRLLAKQAKNHPGKSSPTVAVEGCRASGATKFSKGFVTQFPEDDKDAFLSVDSQESLDSTLSYSKRGYPKGYESERLLETATEVKYLIQFQNKTGEAINKIVVVDSIPAEIDVLTFRPGSASFPYQWEVYGNGWVRFVFDSIQLAAGESGFVKFNVYPKNALSKGTLICNKAAVFVGDNPSTVVEGVCHKIGKDFVKIMTSTPVVPNTTVEVSVAPNPIDDIATVTISGTSIHSGKFLLFDINGKMVYSKTISSEQFQINRNDLPTGLFVFRIESESQIVNHGKLIIR